MELCYNLAPPRVLQYLEAECAYVLSRIEPGDSVLELGCGYGRVLRRFSTRGGLVAGVDTSLASIKYGISLVQENSDCFCVNADAAKLPFRSGVFDRVVCIQNGISAFKVDRKSLVEEGIRIARKGGSVLLSSYSDAFWKNRLEWFEIQADAGLIGEIDYSGTGNGVIKCRDGFSAYTVNPDEFKRLTSEFNRDIRICEVDNSSVFCEIFI